MLDMVDYVIVASHHAHIISSNKRWIDKAMGTTGAGDSMNPESRKRRMNFICVYNVHLSSFVPK